MNRRSAVALLLSALLAAPAALQAQAPAAAPANPAAWSFDKAHSQVGFTIRHLVSRVKGSFRDWTGTLTFADPAKWETAAIDVQVKTASIFTDNERRDNHLRTSDFFLADSFPVISFKSTQIERKGDDAKIHGMLTIRGVTKPVVLDGTFLGYSKGAQQERIGFEASTSINRLDYGVAWNRAVEGGGMTLGDDVKIDINIEAVRRTGGA
jgi:polyisoprenoid-binding protein YceI